MGSHSARRDPVLSQARSGLAARVRSAAAAESQKRDKRAKEHRTAEQVQARSAFMTFVTVFTFTVAGVCLTALAYGPDWWILAFAAFGGFARHVWLQFVG